MLSYALSITYHHITQIVGNQPPCFYKLKIYLNNYFSQSIELLIIKSNPTFAHKFCMKMQNENFRKYFAYLFL